MSISLKSDPGGTKGTLQINGVDKLEINADGSIVALDDAGEMYGMENILGTVSQSAGVPTGAIIERGSNANGEYIKFADGTLICTETVNLGAITAGAGTLANMYRTDPYDATFPATFIATPEFSVITRRAGTSGADRCVGRFYTSVSTTQILDIQAWAGTNTVDDITAKYIAIGRWF